MPLWNFALAEPPASETAKQWWLEHGAGFILLKDVRDYALAQMPDDLTDSEREVAVAAANHALYGLMMVADGVTGRLSNEHQSLTVSVNVELEHRESGDSEGFNLRDSEGVCGWYHQWIEGDFGVAAVAHQTIADS